MMFHLLLTGFLSYLRTGHTFLTDCRLPGILYRGTRNVTESGIDCQRWDTQIPHQHTYNMFSLAQENYCRNFDREEPWCFTIDPRVRWELCGIEVCETPCLNHSFYDKEITSPCISDTSSNKTYCSYILSLISCFKKNIEKSTDTQCPHIELRSIAIQIQNTLEDIIGKSVSECLLSQCRRSLNKSSEIIDIEARCFNMLIKSFPIVSCRNIQQASHCVISKLNDETDHTCIVKDKTYLANSFLSLIPEKFGVDASRCITEFLSEFSAPFEYTTDNSTPSGYQDGKTSIPQTQLFVTLGSTFVLLFVVSVAISAFRLRATILRKKRKDLIHLPNIPKAEDPPYEINLTYPDGLYHDPDYESVDDQDEGYERLPAQMEEIRNQNLVENDSDGVYIDPNNADATYLDVIHPKTYPDDYFNANPYLELEDATFECQTELDPRDISQ